MFRLKGGEIHGDMKGDPAGAAEVIGRMCAPKRSDRYATLAEALDDLEICEA